ncbi:MAG: type II toxin-antitoxin system death-on-curing family toxin [Anaerolineae bacterium]|nr:type II toxin-antitoxin system death-on-curing family toxin [Anaerolineae bacterium]
MRYLTFSEVLDLYHRILEQSGGLVGIRDLGALKSAVAQPRLTFEEQELYPTLVDKAVAIGFSLIKNHPFVDGNKRIGHAAMEVFLLLNGYEIDSYVDDQERIILRVAAGTISREEMKKWLEVHIVALKEG